MKISILGEQEFKDKIKSLKRLELGGNTIIKF